MPSAAATAPAAPADSSSTTTLYEMLGVPPEASLADIRQAYLRAARQHHPDRQTGQPKQRPASPVVAEDASGSALFLLIKEAWDTLGDPAKRAAYDKALAERAGEGAGFVSEELEVDEMDADEALGGWTYPCRCGEAFQVLEEELPEGASILVTCDGCSLRARVHRNKPPPSPSLSVHEQQEQQEQQQSEGEARRTPDDNGASNWSSVLRPTRGQAELDEDEDEDAGRSEEQQQGSTASSRRRRRREEPRSLEAAGPLRVLYQGHDLLIIDKPPDVRMQGPFDVTVETLVRRWCPEAAPASVGLKWIHQLDHATSGVLCIGLSRRVAAAAGDLFARRVVTKEYVALLKGHLDPSTLPLREEAGIYSHATMGYNEGSLSGIRLDKRRPHKLGVIYKPAPSFYREKQLAAERRHKEQGDAALSPTERGLLVTKWRDARESLREVVKECEALAAADEARAAAAKREQEAEDKRNREASADDELPTQDLGAFRRPHDPEGSFVVDVSITELKDDFRVRLGRLPAEEPGVVYNTGPRRARTLGRVLARGYLTSAATGGCEGSGCSARSKAVTKVLLRPVTGRRHQLRVHTLYMGHPIVGDTTYTGDTDSLRMMLHAASLTLPFPANKGAGCTISVATVVDPFGPYFKPL